MLFQGVADGTKIFRVGRDIDFEIFQPFIGTDFLQQPIGIAGDAVPVETFDQNAVVRYGQFFIVRGVAIFGKLRQTPIFLYRVFDGYLFPICGLFAIIMRLF